MSNVISIGLCLDSLNYTPSRGGLLFQCAAILGSFVSMLHFCRKHVRHSPVHLNFKLLLVLYFIKCYVHGFVFLSAAANYYYRQLISGDGAPEHVFVSREFYKYVHLMYATTVHADPTIKVLLVIERTWATFRARNYENESSRCVRWLFVVFAFIYPTSMTLFAYWNADFDSPACFALFTPDGTMLGVNVMFIIQIVTSALSIVYVKYLIRLNTRKLENQQFHLTTRYQLHENLSCTHFLSTVLVSSFSVALFFGVSTLALRVGPFDGFRNNPPFFAFLRMAIYPIPLADLLIPIYSGNQMKRERTVKMIHLNEAIKNSPEVYDKMLKAQWA
ncbi:unnamed protein product [Caenorhabditis sp. 36 PRJEB53466]|nr:unnamed protein product [Caenorhabditis sp. 36 PRJEB53466]